MYFLSGLTSWAEEGSCPRGHHSGYWTVQEVAKQQSHFGGTWISGKYKFDWFDSFTSCWQHRLRNWGWVVIRWTVSALRLEPRKIFRFLHCKRVYKKLPMISVDINYIGGGVSEVQDTLEQQNTSWNTSFVVFLLTHVWVRQMWFFCLTNRTLDFMQTHPEPLCTFLFRMVPFKIMDRKEIHL